jgi:NADH-ubiquinone oxidoreductase chain 5
MYLTIIFLPLLAALTSGFLGRKIGVRGSYFITSISLIITTVLAHLAFYSIGIKENTIIIKLFDWLDSGSFLVEFGFNFDGLTVSMLLPVLIVSSLVHIYSIGYMENDPHQQRFFSYLSMFTFFMLILVTADNFLLMFVGWEGILKCLKWSNIILFV